MSHVFSSRYFSIIKADKLQREDTICVSTSLCLVLGIHFLFTIRITSFPTPEIHNRAAETVDMLTVKLSRECFIYFLHYVLCLIEKASLHIKEKLIRCLHQVENHILNKPGRLKSREKSIGCFFIQVERGKEIDQCQFLRHKPS